MSADRPTPLTSGPAGEPDRPARGDEARAAGAPGPDATAPGEAATVTADAAVAWALARAATYRLLAATFAYPDAERLARVRDLAAAAAAALTGEGAGRPWLEALGAAGTAATPELVADEHVFLFDRQVRCSTHEGAWAGAPSLAGSAAQLADVAGFYRAFGLEPGDAEPETEDHIAAELEFMSVLALKEAYGTAEGDGEAVETVRAAEAAFLGDHLGRWAGMLAGALRETCTLPYHTAVADALEAWIAEEVARWGVRPAPVGASGPPGVEPDDSLVCPMAAGPAEDPGLPG